MIIKGEQIVKFKAPVKNVTEFFNLYPDVTITHIDGKKADEICESCECAISRGDKCYQWNDIGYTCLKCGGADSGHKPIVLE